MAADRSAPNTTSTPTTPKNAKSSGPCEIGVSDDAPSATTGAIAEEEDVAEDDGTTGAHTKSSAIGLMRTAGRISLARAPGGISLVRIVLKATPDSLRCCHRQEGMTNTIKTSGLGASRNRMPSPASWAELRP